MAEQVAIARMAMGNNDQRVGFSLRRLGISQRAALQSGRNLRVSGDGGVLRARHLPRRQCCWIPDFHRQFASVQRSGFPLAGTQYVRPIRQADLQRSDTNAVCAVSSQLWRIRTNNVDSVRLGQ